MVIFKAFNISNLNHWLYHPVFWKFTGNHPWCHFNPSHTGSQLSGSRWEWQPSVSHPKCTQGTYAALLRSPSPWLGATSLLHWGKFSPIPVPC